MKNLFLKMLEILRDRQARFRCRREGHEWERLETDVDSLLGITTISYGCEHCPETALVTESVRDTVSRYAQNSHIWGERFVTAESGMPLPPKELA